MEEWKEYKLADVCSRLRSGKGIKSDSVLDAGPYPVIGGNGIRGYANESNFKGECAVIGRQGAYCGNVRFYEGEAYMTEHAVVVVGNELADTRFLACLLSLMHLGNLSAQSAQPGISVQTLSKQIVSLPSIDYQKRVSAVIKSLDEKIEVNRRINDNLEQQAQALFKSWFVDFEPFKDGEFVESELGMIPKGWRVGTLFDVAEILDKFRKPLSGKDRESMEKIYPYYGATSCMDYVDNYIFDGIYTLIGEDGSVAKENGLPYMQYVWGKLWVNNHAHILQGKNGFSTEMVHVMLSMTNIQHLVTGAVQAKLSQANMEKILLPIPPSEVLENIRPNIDKQYEIKRNNEDESRRLATLRDTLLPKLMSGELIVNEVEI
ncbi:restriction endonuclease subunit S [Prevotella sp. E13-27]|uniref:restriction endonuclease subunit S n=1 Tax=Prevotella sp. E13-27 TaxID=2938122 RepID=UPI00200AE0A2|nr:restriction endonuclease subunit S [Prevotella sp. E13-27]MCK8623544.1 restriction endonuclease subunit S [Prevotella sp. E13-27]